MRFPWAVTPQEDNMKEPEQIQHKEEEPELVINYTCCMSPISEALPLKEEEKGEGEEQHHEAVTRDGG